jgi:hypothetical protein
LRDQFLRHKPNRITRELELAVGELEALAAGKSTSRGSTSQLTVEA